MNFSQTKQALQYLWGTHPAAPRFSADDKRITALCYFRVLYKYSINDVLSAIDKACRKNPTFIPSAFEIEENIEKTIDWEKYVTNYYLELDSKYSDKKYCSMREYYQTAILRDGATSDELRKLYSETCREILARIDINEQLHEMEKEYIQKATEYYNTKEINKAKGDLKAMGLIEAEDLKCLI